MMALSVNKKPILVTGGTGFVGRHLVEYLVSRGFNVRVLGRRPVVRWRDHSHISHLRGDISSPEVLERAIAGVHGVIHLAAGTTGNWEAYDSVTVQASKRLFELTVDSPAQRIVMISSVGNYERSDTLIDELSPLQSRLEGRGYYARAKVIADRMAQEYLGHSSLQLTIVRPGLIYGRGMKNPLVGIGFRRGRLVLAPGGLSKRIPLIHIDDVVRAIAEIFVTPQTAGRIYNLVHHEQPTRGEFLAAYNSCGGERAYVVPVPLRPLLPLFRAYDSFTKIISGKSPEMTYKALRAIDSPTYSAARLRDEIGFEATVKLTEGMFRMLQVQRITEAG